MWDNGEDERNIRKLSVIAKLQVKPRGAMFCRAKTELGRGPGLNRGTNHDSPATASTDK